MAAIVVAVVMLAVFLAGALIGAILMVAAAVRSEDRRASLKGEAPRWAVTGVRRRTRIGARGDVYGRLSAELP
jgi:uncharacterized membrane protein